MIRVRQPDGSVIEAPPGSFVEICDQEGSIAVLSYIDTSFIIRSVRASDKAVADRYSKLFGVKFVNLVPLNLQPP